MSKESMENFNAWMIATGGFADEGEVLFAREILTESQTDLIEALISRHKLGYREWTVPKTSAKTKVLTSLSELGVLTYRPHNMEGAYYAELTGDFLDANGLGDYRKRKAMDRAIERIVYDFVDSPFADRDYIARARREVPVFGESKQEELTATTKLVAIQKEVIGRVITECDGAIKWNPAGLTGAGLAQALLDGIVLAENIHGVEILEPHRENNPYRADKQAPSNHGPRVNSEKAFDNLQNAFKGVANKSAIMLPSISDQIETLTPPEDSRDWLDLRPSDTRQVHVHQLGTVRVTTVTETL